MLINMKLIENHYKRLHRWNSNGKQYNVMWLAVRQEEGEERGKKNYVTFNKLEVFFFHITMHSKAKTPPASFNALNL